MNIQNIQEKMDLIQTEGKKLLSKQIGYIDSYYDLTSEELEHLVYHWSQNELVLYAPVDVLESLSGTAGYDFSTDEAKIYVKIENNALIVVVNKDDIQFFKEIFIDSINSEDFDDEGNFIEEE
ncbi:hypothetical protein SAMN04487895_101698 [Paenibacillus sophorae]|uniref:Uncharacterized protein n=1 Tax=Paenibacillus sophorae TaxID=1333845 RepID=A0A1H8GZS3_9BACL|nr:hypothetical protein [Paenibacillus sophorae]QWU14389.1 hypothetical protein KP014_21005 [Paenibacillus sophorae]SEN49290.1 hypothetical protein SAMN04487895_101698 [Paenibacillus sophorae]